MEQVQPGETAFRTCIDRSSPSNTKSISSLRLLRSINCARIPGLAHCLKNLCWISGTKSLASLINRLREYFLISSTASLEKLKFEWMSKLADLEEISTNSLNLKLSRYLYCSLQNAGIAVGPILTLPSTCIVKCTPKKGCPDRAPGKCGLDKRQRVH